MSDDFFAPPPFDPAKAQAMLARALRDLKLVERHGVFELDGRPVARVALHGAVLKLSVARKPARSPEWEHGEAADHAMLRRFIDDLKKRMARWGDARGND